MRSCSLTRRQWAYGLTWLSQYASLELSQIIIIKYCDNQNYRPQVDINIIITEGVVSKKDNFGDRSWASERSAGLYVRVIFSTACTRSVRKQNILHGRNYLVERCFGFGHRADFCRIKHTIYPIITLGKLTSNCYKYRTEINFTTKIILNVSMTTSSLDR